MAVLLVGILTRRGGMTMDGAWWFGEWAYWAALAVLLLVYVRQSWTARGLTGALEQRDQWTKACGDLDRKRVALQRECDALWKRVKAAEEMAERHKKDLVTELELKAVVIEERNAALTESSKLRVANTEGLVSAVKWKTEAARLGQLAGERLAALEKAQQDMQKAVQKAVALLRKRDEEIVRCGQALAKACDERDVAVRAKVVLEQMNAKQAAMLADQGEVIAQLRQITAAMAERKQAVPSWRAPFDWRAAESVGEVPVLVTDTVWATLKVAIDEEDCDVFCVSRAEASSIKFKNCKPESLDADLDELCEKAPIAARQVHEWRRGRCPLELLTPRALQFLGKLVPVTLPGWTWEESELGGEA